MLPRLSPDQWAAIDQALFRHQLALGVRLLHEATGLEIHAAADALVERHSYLRARYPRKFADPEAHYWDGFGVS